MLKTRTRRPAALVLVVLLGSVRPVLAGPPLICHAFETGTAAVLSWKGPAWNAPDPAYDVRRLTADTLRLLTSDAPVLARMENMRRATIYAMTDPVVAHELLSAILGRTLRDAGGGSAHAIFDAGYLVESYRQAAFLRTTAARDRLAWAATDETLREDGYVLVKKAMQIGGPNAEMEYAASLMTRGPVAAAHRARALASAPRGSLLAVNLSR